MAIISAPNPKYSGVTAGVTFVDGVAETDEENALNYFARQGYTIDDEIEVDPETVTLSETKPTVDATQAELVAWAAAQEPPISDVTEDMTKAQIIGVVDTYTDEVEIVIDTHPSNETKVVDETAEFTVTTSAGTNVTFQWQVQAGGEGDWLDIEDATADTYVTPELTIDNDGDRFRVVLSNARGSVTSNSATLTVTEE